MDSARRRMRSTGPSRSGAGPRARRGPGSARSARNEARPAGADPLAESAGPSSMEGPAASMEGPAAPVEGSTGDAAAARTPEAARPGSLRSSVFRRGRATSRPVATRPGTAPSAAVTGSGRRIGRISARGPSVPPATRARSQLAKQVAVLGLVLCAVALALAVPLRNYLSQRAAQATAVSQEQQLRTRLAVLEQQQAALSDPAYVQSEAKRRLQYVRPGETVYVVHAPPLSVPTAAKPAAPQAVTSWYSNLWNTLADPTATVPPEKKAVR